MGACTIWVLSADLEEHRPSGWAHDWVHEPLAHTLDLGDHAIVAHAAVRLRAVGAFHDGEACVSEYMGLVRRACLNLGRPAG